MAAPAKLISTSVGFQDAKGNLVANGFLSLQLEFASEVIATGGQITTQPLILSLDANAKITTVAIWFTDELSGSPRYRALLYGSNGATIVTDFGFWSITGASADLSLMTAVSSGGTFPAPVLLSPSGNQNISQPSGTDLNVNRFEQIRFADQFSGSSVTAKLDAALADLGGGSGLVIIPSSMGTGLPTSVPSSAVILDLRNGGSSPSVGFGILRNFSPSTAAQILGMNLEIGLNPSVDQSNLNFAQASELFTFASNTKNFTGAQTSVYGSFSHFGSGTSNGLYGGAFEGFNSGSATALLIVGCSATANNGGVNAGIPVQTATNNGNSTNLRAFDGIANNTSSGTVTNAVAFFAETPHNSGGGTITNAYGLFIADQNVGSNKWAIKTGLGKVQFGDVLVCDSSAQISTTVGIGAAPITLAGLLINNTALSGSTQIGMLSAPVCTSAATIEGEGGRFRVDTAAAAFTLALAQAIHVVEGVKGSGSTITTQVGLDVDTLANGGTNIAIRTGTNPCQWGGLFTKYNNIATVSGGIPAEYATVDLTAQTAAIGTTTLYAVPASGAGQYRLTWNSKVTTAAGVSSTLGALTIVYTDPDSVVQTITAGAQTSAGAIATTSTGNSTTTVLLGVPMLLNCKASTNITYAFAYASNAANAMNYNLHIKLEAM